jgi:hypothetical protein
MNPLAMEHRSGRNGNNVQQLPRSRLRDNFQSQLPVWVAVQPPISRTPITAGLPVIRDLANFKCLCNGDLKAHARADTSNRHADDDSG